MRLAVTLRDWSEKTRFSALGAEVFLVHPEGLSCKTPRMFSLAEIRGFIRDCRRDGGRLYVDFNTMIHSEDLPRLNSFLEAFASEPPDAIVAFDLAVCERARAFGLLDRVIYRPVTMNANSADLRFFRSLGLKGVTLSQELSLDDWAEMARHADGLELSATVHGHLDLFYSRRPLLANHYKRHGIPDRAIGGADWRLEESSRPGERLPIWQDETGTHLFSARKRESFTALRTMGPLLSDVFLERLFLSDAEYEAALAAYADPAREEPFMREFGQGYGLRGPTKLDFPAGSRS